MTALSLQPADVAIASLLVLASAGLSILLSLRLHRALLVAAVRLVVQLLLVGFVLRQVFALSSPWLTAAVIVAMLAAAGREVGARQERRLAGPWHFAIGSATVAAATLGVTLFGLLTALRPSPWWDARHAIPLAGIVLGTTLNAASLSLDRVLGGATREARAIEARLALGASRHLAFRDLVRGAVRAGLIPTINQMAAAGIITLPGIMTGQVLAGMDPIEAAKYQIVLMFLLAGAGFFGAAGAATLAVWRLTDERDRLRLDRLAPAGKR